MEEQNGLEVKKLWLQELLTSRVRFHPGDHFSKPCTLHLPDCFAKIEEDRRVKPISSSSPPVIDLSKRIIHNDPNLIVLNKPAGVCCQVIVLLLIQRSHLQTRSSACIPFCVRFFHRISSILSIGSIALRHYLLFTLGYDRRAASCEGQKNCKSHRKGVGTTECRQNLHCSWIRSNVFEEVSTQCWNYPFWSCTCL